MSLAEIKHSIETCSVEQRLELAALIAHLNRADDAEYAAELEDRLTAMDAGKKFPRAHLDQLHAELSAKGR